MKWLQCRQFPELVYFSLADVVVLTVPTGPLVVYEGDEGESTLNQTCFNATLNQPRSRDSIFVITVSSMSTATSAVDFEPLGNITVPTNYSGDVYEECVNITVIGDAIVEDDEFIIFNITALSPLDIVTSSDGSNTLQVTIIDNDGKL
jgi:hypothetical protein